MRHTWFLLNVSCKSALPISPHVGNTHILTHTAHSRVHVIQVTVGDLEMNQMQ